MQTPNTCQRLNFLIIPLLLFVGILLSGAAWGQQQVISFTLVNSTTDQDIQTITNGAVIDIAGLSGVNIRANTNPTTVGSVIMNLSGATTAARTESTAPYALFGDSNGNYDPGTLNLGSHTISGTPYTQSGGNGTAGTALTISFTIVNAPPTAPTSLTATTISATQINLSWTDNSSNETGFEIERSLTSGSGYTLIQTTASNAVSFSNTGLSAGTTYYYRIRAINAGGNSAYTSVANATTTAGAPNAPSGLTATTASSSQINLSWTDNSSNETGFEIERSLTSGSGYTLIQTTASNAVTFSNTGLSAGTTYYYRIRAINAGGNSAYTSVANATTTAGAPNAPSGLTATAASSSQINLNWTDNSSNETGFEIERSLTSGSGYTLIQTTASNAVTFSNTGLSAGTTYYYRIRAVNGNGNSSYSSEANATTTTGGDVVVSITLVNSTTDQDIQTITNGAIIDIAGLSGVNIRANTNPTTVGSVIMNLSGATTAARTESTAPYALFGDSNGDYAPGTLNLGSHTISVTPYTQSGGNGTAGTALTINFTIVNAPPTAPTSLTATAISATQINLSWTDNSSNETGFEIERSLTSGSGYTLIQTTASNAVSFSNTGLSAGTTYYYRIRAINAGGGSAYTAVANATTTSTGAPSAPSGLIATTASSSQINLSWTDNSSNETGFEIERSLTSGSGYTLIQTTASNAVTFSNTGLSSGTTYYYRIRAINAGGNSAYTSVANATTIPAAPIAPSGLTATTASSSQINLSWTDNSSNETGFEIERSLTSGSGYTLIQTTASNVVTFSSTGLSSGTTYYYRIRAINAGGNSAYTSVANATTTVASLVAPNTLTATTISTTQINLTWVDASSNETGFQIERSLTAGSGFVLIATTSANATTYANTGLTAGTKYFYRVRAVNAGGNSNYSAEASAVCDLIAPTGLTAMAASSSQVKLEWNDASANETGFAIERATLSGGPYTVVTTTAANMGSYTDMGLSVATQYYYRIRAVNVGGISAYTSVVGAKTMTQDEETINLWAFQYKYDGRKRMTHKKVPGAEWMYMVYDNRDRLVMSQDGNQRKFNQWLFTKYDVLNRPVLTGIYTHGSSADQPTMQGIVNTYYNQVAGPAWAWYETFSTTGTLHGYDNKSYPTANTEVLTVTYYDSYDFKVLYGNEASNNYKTGELSPQTSLTGTYPQEPSANLNRVNGLVTATKTKMLGSTSDYLLNITYYDQKYRPIQTISDNHKGGKDYTTSIYDFTGKVLASKTTHGMPSQADKIVTRTLDYDHGGRLMKTWHQVGTGTKTLLAMNEYNELGQLVTKNLHNTDPTTTADASRLFKQMVDYRYNIRGWLTKVNNATTPTPGDWFSMELNYNTPTANGGTAQYNGNISETLWRGPDATLNSYGYYYDPMNRLVEAKYFNATESTKNNRFNEKIWDEANNKSGYDLNGNIKYLNRKGMTGTTAGITTYGTIDNLTYTYTGNQLQKVDDSAIKTEGFKETGTGYDYNYDANGNMLTDLNKDIAANIRYNHLNLPERVTKADGEYVKYTYDATGRKLKQEVFNASNVVTKTTDYLGEYIYENDLLQFINHEEGRITKNEATGNFTEYQYHLKDHLGNVRVTFTTKDETINETATLEDANLNVEQSQFLRYANAKRIQSSLFDRTNGISPTTTTGYSVRLNGSTDEVYGLAKSLSVMPGDKINTEVYYKYIDPAAITSGTAAGDALLALLGQITAGAGGVVVDGALYGSSTASFPTAYAGLLDKNDNGAPRAYLNWLVFDRNFGFITGGFKQIILNSGKETGTDVPFGYIASPDINITQAGYVYIYLSNESMQAPNASSLPKEVFFDDFKVTHTKSPVIQQDDYYPFGLTFNSFTKENATPNMYQYNGKEKQDELGLDWLDFDARMYMPEIGRWGVIDPAADAQLPFSPYHFAYNNPVRFNDPTGLIGEDFREGLATTIVNEDTGEKYEIDDGFDFEFIVSSEDFARISESGAIPDDLKPAWNKEFWRQVGLELQKSSGDSWFDKFMQFFVYDDAGEAVVTVTDGKYASAVLGVALSRLKIGQGSKLVKKLFKYGNNKRMPTPKLDGDQFKKVGDKFIHKETGAIYSKSHTSHGNVGNTGDQWKVWPKGTTDFGNASKKAGTRVTIDGDGNVIGN